MDCPICRAPQTRVLETRQVSDDIIRRRRECHVCGKRVTTEEHFKTYRPNRKYLKDELFSQHNARSSENM